MWQILKRYPKAYLWSGLLHLTLLVLMLTGVDWLVRNQEVGGFENMVQLIPALRCLSVREGQQWHVRRGVLRCVGVGDAIDIAG